MQQIHQSVDSFVLLAIPLFVFAGMLMETGGIAVRLVRLAQALVGWIRGGLAMAVVIAEYIFSGVSGSTIADVSAIGATMIPPMTRAGYRPGQAVSIVAAASAMGILVPPCILMIVLGSIANVSVAALFVAGFIPAVVLAAGHHGVHLLGGAARGHRAAAPQKRPRDRPRAQARADPARPAGDHLRRHPRRRDDAHRSRCARGALRVRSSACSSTARSSGATCRRS